jgi:hypothetical protein
MRSARLAQIPHLSTDPRTRVPTPPFCELSEGCMSGVQEPSHSAEDQEGSARISCGMHKRGRRGVREGRAKKRLFFGVRSMCRWALIHFRAVKSHASQFSMTGRAMTQMVAGCRLVRHVRHWRSKRRLILPVPRLPFVPYCGDLYHVTSLKGKLWTCRRSSCVRLCSSRLARWK